jgi:all-trans-8'-apo-beta-carotenal 15,15'-oxygenase
LLSVTSLAPCLLLTWSLLSLHLLVWYLLTVYLLLLLLPLTLLLTHPRGGARTQLMRLVLDLKHTSSKMYPMARRTLEFPSINWGTHTRPHTHIYAGGDVVDDEVYWAPLQCFCKLTVDPLAGVTQPLVFERDVVIDSWYAGDRCYVMEPLFVPRRRPKTPGAGSMAATASSSSSSSGSSNGGGVGHQAEDDGWVLATLYDAAKGQGALVIFDAQNMSRGPVAKINLPHHLPSGLHGSWCPQYFGPEEGSAVPTWRPPRQIRQL